MTTYGVYRIEHPDEKTVRVGTVTDRRRREGNRIADMVRLAKKLYPSPSFESDTFIVMDGSPLNLFLIDPFSFIENTG